MKLLANHSSFGKVRVSGQDRVTVLHNILTQDIQSLPIGGHSPTALLTHTGKILLLMEVFCFKDFLILVIENQSAAAAIPLMEKYIITEDVQLEDVTGQYAFFQSYGPRPEKFLLSPVIPAQAGIHESIDSRFRGNDNKPSSKVILPKGYQLVDDKTAEVLRIESGIPLYGVDMDENTILSETGLEKTAVSETKGCYPGQEVVARIQTYKGLTKRLCRLVLEGAVLPKKEDKIYTDSPNMSFPHAYSGNPQNSKNGSPIKSFGDDMRLTEIGWITSAAYSQSLQKTCALGYLIKGYFEASLAVTVISEGKEIAGRT